MTHKASCANPILLIPVTPIIYISQYIFLFHNLKINLKSSRIWMILKDVASEHSFLSCFNLFFIYL